MTERMIPRPDLMVAIDIPVGGGQVSVTRRIATVRDLGDGRYACLLVDPDTKTPEAVTIAPAAGGHWVCTTPPVSITAAVHLAQLVAAGHTLHRSVTEQMRMLAEAVLLLTGQARQPGNPAPARVEGGQP